MSKHGSGQEAADSKGGKAGKHREDPRNEGKRVQEATKKMIDESKEK